MHILKLDVKSTQRPRRIGVLGQHGGTRRLFAVQASLSARTVNRPVHIRRHAAVHLRAQLLDLHILGMHQRQIEPLAQREPVLHARGGGHTSLNGAHGNPQRQRVKDLEDGGSLAVAVAIARQLVQQEDEAEPVLRCGGLDQVEELVCCRGGRSD
ncbi:predicted protein [Aspergillus terreus NIH2624]|uniref:Uncharacterized protein n=1 Tax=Aspergillus terreus (strain NIH 2624 / FGSC A1156) TaxID=341663 RepID=Q0CKL3_ASPTN|nr:uncharacterized protein ATEG_05771 [Aspergillus terreus NIH2624]EAU33532.1 predicted protein [Aspergillus terreus NIH2624]